MGHLRYFREYYIKMKPKAIIVSGYFNPIRLVDKCFLSIDKDRTVVELIKMIFKQFGNEYQLAFANGGDQNNDTISESPICEELGIELMDGLGGKIQSSFWLLLK